MMASVDYATGCLTPSPAAEPTLACSEEDWAFELRLRALSRRVREWGRQNAVAVSNQAVAGRLDDQISKIRDRLADERDLAVFNISG